MKEDPLLAALIPDDLTEIADKAGTDKGSTPGETGHPHRYAPIYQRYLERLKNEPIHILEIGVFKGASLRLWEEYFPSAKILGVDISASASGTASERSQVVIGDATDRDLIRKAVDEALDGRVDIVIDDGSHIFGHQLTAFENIFPILSSGGLYFFEDITCSRFDGWNLNSRGFEDFFEFASWLSEHLTYFPEDSFQTYHSITDDRNLVSVDTAYIRSPWNNWLHEVSLFHNMCVVSKAPRIFLSGPASDQAPSARNPMPELDVGSIRSPPGAPTFGSRKRVASALARRDGLNLAEGALAPVENEKAAKDIVPSLPITNIPVRAKRSKALKEKLPPKVSRFFEKLSLSFDRRYIPFKRDAARLAVEKLPIKLKRKAKLWRQAQRVLHISESACPPGYVPCTKYDVLVLANIDIKNTGRHRPHHIASHYAKRGHRVFYIIADPMLQGPESHAYEMEIVESNLFRVRMRGRGFNHYANNVTGEALAEFEAAFCVLIRDWRIAAGFVHVHLPSWTNLALSLQTRFGLGVIYDCMDEWNGFPLITSESLALESKLVATADAVAVTSAPLLAKFRNLSSNCVLIRNGVEYKRFARDCVRNDMFDFAKPVIGFFGSIAEWIDLELIRDVALLRPDWTFVLAGPSHVSGLSGLDQLANVRILGTLPYETIPKLLWHFDVAIMPFQVNTMTHSVNPVKLHEYLAGGKPVVSTPLAELSDYNRVLSVADDAETFAQAIAYELQLDDELRRQERRQLARESDWNKRVDEFDRVSNDALPSVSIIIVTYNNLRLTKRCLSSVLSNTVAKSLEVIVVDNNSADETAQYLMELADKDGRVKAILNKDNRGFAAANNQGLEAASGDVLILLNNDTVVPRSWLRGLLAALKDSSVGLVGPTTNMVGNEARIPVSYKGLGDLDDFANLRMAEHAGEIFDIEMLAMFCVAMRRDIWLKVGALDENYGLGLFEDDDYSKRIKQLGLRVVCCSGSFIHHYGQSSFKKLIQTGEYNILWQTNQAYFESKWGKWSAHQWRRD